MDEDYRGNFKHLFLSFFLSKRVVFSLSKNTKSCYMRNPSKESNKNQECNKKNAQEFNQKFSASW